MDLKFGFIEYQRLCLIFIAHSQALTTTLTCAEITLLPLYLPLPLLSSPCQHTHHIILVLPILMLNLTYFKYTTMWEM